MLGDVFLGTITAIGTAIVKTLPNVSTTTAFVASAQTASGYLAGLNVIVPVDSILTILFFYVVFEGGYLAFKGIYWLIRRLPTQS